MNRKIGIVSSAINLLAVLGFAVSMSLRFNFGSYFCFMFIAFSAFSFVPMMCCFLHFAVPDYGKIHVSCNKKGTVHQKKDE